MKYLCSPRWKRLGAAEVPVVVPLVVGVVVVAAAVGVGLLLRKSPEKDQSVAKGNTPPTTQKAPNLAPMRNPNVGGVPNLPNPNQPNPNQPNPNPAVQPTPTPPKVPAGPPPNLKQGFDIGNLAPEIRGDDVDGNFFKLSDYRGKVVVLDFWGHW